MQAIFICSGNICRSPMAAAIFTAELRARDERGAAISMSTLGLHGRPASRNAIAAVAEFGLNLEGHRSQPVSAGLLKHADVIFVMQDAHREHVLRVAPSVAPRIRLLGAYDPDGGPEEIEDPVGQPLDAFRISRDRIRRSIRGWFEARG